MLAMQWVKAMQTATLVRRVKRFLDKHARPPNDWSSLAEALRLCEEKRYFESILWQKAVSIIVPTYNKKLALQKTIAALAHQDYPLSAIELVIADDGSADGTEDWVRATEFLFNIKYIKQQKHGYRVAKVRNEGLKVASHGIVILLDADMAPTHNFVTSHMRWHTFLNNVVVIGHRKYIEPENLTFELINQNIRALESIPETDNRKLGISTDWRIRRYNATNFLKSSQQPYLCFCGGNVSFRKQIAFEAGLFDEEFNFWGGEDIEFGYRLFHLGTYLVPELSALALHQEHYIEYDWKASQQRARELLEKKIQTFQPRKGNRLKVSVYIPSYNSAQYIKEAIDSVLNQTLQDIEICICDDGSTDGTIRVLQENYSHRSNMRWTVQPHRGVAAASNDAVRMCQGDYIAQLDADDRLKPTALEELMNFLESHPRYGMVYSDYEKIDANGQFLRPGWAKYFGSQKKFKEYLANKGMYVHPLRMFRRECFYQTSGFNEDLKSAVDYDLALKLSEVCDLYHYPRVLYEYRWHGNNMSIVRHDEQVANAARARAHAQIRRTKFKEFIILSEKTLA